MLGRCRLRILALALALLCAAPVTVTAQDTTKIPPTATREQARATLATLSDEDVRKLLLEHLDRALPPGAAAASSPWVLTSSDTALERLKALMALARSGGLLEEWNRLADAAGAGRSHPWLGMVAAILICLGAGALIERFMLRRNGVLGGLQEIGRTATGGKLGAGQVLLGGAARSVGALVFLAGSVLALQLVPGLSTGARTLASAAIWVIGGTRLVFVGIHAVLLPVGGESPWPVSRPLAQTVARHLAIVIAVVLLLQASRDVLQSLGAAADFATIFRLAISVLLIAAVIWGLFTVRAALGPTGPGKGAWRLLRERWHLLATGYVLLVFVLGIYQVLVTGQPVLLQALASLSLVLVIPVADYGLQRLAARLVPAPQVPQTPLLHPPADALSDASSGPPAHPATVQVADEGPRAGRPSQVEEALLLNFQVLLALAVAQTICSLWNIRIFDLVSALLGDRLAGALSEIAVASLFAFIVWQIIIAAASAYAVPEQEGFDLNSEGGNTGLTRAQTLMPLISKTVGVMLIVMLTMISLAALGVNIGPLLAGAGVVGLAVGFGAQTLVRDIVSGIFFLAEDAFRMGEYVQIGNTQGTVEKILIRSLRLRHHRGPLHTLPYGEVRSMTNYSRDYAIMKLELRVPFETDVEKVRKLIKQVGVELAQNEEYASVMLEPLKSQGVNRMDDSAFVITCKFTTVPGKQFGIRRVVFAKIQEAFAREGIHFAPRRVVVETAAPAGSAEALAAAAAAAIAAQGDDEQQPRHASANER